MPLAVNIALSCKHFNTFQLFLFAYVSCTSSLILFHKLSFVRTVTSYSHCIFQMWLHRRAMATLKLKANLSQYALSFPIFLSDFTHLFYRLSVLSIKTSKSFSFSTNYKASVYMYICLQLYIVDITYNIALSYIEKQLSIPCLNSSVQCYIICDLFTMMLKRHQCRLKI